MSYRKKSFNERFRTFISFLVAISVATVLLIGTGYWGDKAPLLEGSLMLCGAFLAGIGAFGRIWCSLYIAGYKNTKLITEGPYALCRNPLYFFSFVGGVGAGMTTECLTIPFLIALFFLFYYPSIIKREQKRLLEIFGKDYEDYIASGVPSFFPKWGTKITQPATYVVVPKTFFKSMGDALWFIWVIGIFEFVSSLHSAEILPTFFLLP